MTYNGSGMNHKLTWTGSGSGLELKNFKVYRQRHSETLSETHARPTRDPKETHEKSLIDLKETHERHMRNQFKTDWQHLRDHWN